VPCDDIRQFFYNMREDVYRVVKAFVEKKEVLSAQAQRFVDRVPLTPIKPFDLQLLHYCY